MLATIIALVALQAAPQKLALPRLKTVGLTTELAGFYEDDLAQELGKLGFEVYTQDKMATLLGMERQRQLMACEEGSSCLAELSSALGAKGVITGSLGKLGKAFQVNLSVLDPSDGHALAMYSARADSEEEMLDTLATAARAIAEGLNPSAKKTSAHAAWITPVRKFSLAGAGVAVAGGGTAVALLLASYHRYQVLTAQTPMISFGDAMEASSSGRTLQTVGIAVACVAGAALITGIILWFVGAPP
jgi:hypothetical protein